MTIRKEQIKTALAHVLHPEKKMDIISLNMIQDIIVQEKLGSQKTLFGLKLSRVKVVQAKGYRTFSAGARGYSCFWL